MSAAAGLRRLRYATSEAGSTVSYAASHTLEQALREMSASMRESIRLAHACIWPTSVALWRREVIATLPRAGAELDFTEFGRTLRSCLTPLDASEPCLRVDVHRWRNT